MNEETIEAAHRRLMEELGFDCELEKSFEFIYKTDFNNGLIEHEYDHVIIGKYDGEIIPNPDEVAEIKFMSLEEIKKDIKLNADNYTFWFKIAFEQIYEQLKFSSFKKLIA